MLRSRPMRGSKSSLMTVKEREVSRNKLKYILAGGIVVCIFVIVFLAYGLSNPSLVQTSRLQDVGKETWDAKQLPVAESKQLSNEVSMVRLKGILNEILIPRVPGSKNITIVTSNIVSRLQDLGWKLKHDSFTDKAPPPYGDVKFRSVIATHNPNLSRRIILACHHDSKVTPKGFLGATDSAVPCSIMLEMAYVLNKSLNALREQQTAEGLQAHGVTLQLLFLDGEEAFVDWGPNDSIYGAKHLAAKWKRTNKLKSIDLFVLLDLIGTIDTTFHDFQTTRTRWFRYAGELESRMTTARTLEASHKRLFSTHSKYARFRIEDDHIPFLREGVPVLHLINAPFSPVWHTINDNYEALDFDRIELVTKIMVNFVAEYLHLSVGSSER